MKPHLGKNTIVETPEQARARIFRMDKIERRLAEIRAIEKQCQQHTQVAVAVVSLNQAIKILEMREQAKAEVRRAG